MATAKKKTRKKSVPTRPGRNGGTLKSGGTKSPGRPPEDPEVKALAREWTGEAIATLAGIMRSSKNDSTRVKAAEILLDRGWGKPKQEIEASGPGGGPLVISFE